MGNLHAEPGKRELLESLLQGGMVLLHLDARKQGVDVPPGLREESELGLNLSRRFPGPLIVDDTGVEATLSFAGEPYSCALPFDAVYAMIAHETGEGFFFPADAPPAALAALAAVLEEESSGEPRASARAPCSPSTATPTLSVIEGGAGRPISTDALPANAIAPSDAPAAADDTQERPRLRLVK